MLLTRAGLESREVSNASDHGDHGDRYSVIVTIVNIPTWTTPSNPAEEVLRRDLLHGVPEFKPGGVARHAR